jgi:hypothetical protein
MFKGYYLAVRARMCKGVAVVTSFVGKLQPYVDEWASAAHEENVVTDHLLHDGAAWVAYL